PQTEAVRTAQPEGRPQAAEGDSSVRSQDLSIPASGPSITAQGHRGSPRGPQQGTLSKQGIQAHLQQAQGQRCSVPPQGPRAEAAQVPCQWEQGRVPSPAQQWHPVFQPLEPHPEQWERV